MLYTRFVIGEETLSSTSVFNFCHCAIFSRLINSFIQAPVIGHYRKLRHEDTTSVWQEHQVNLPGDSGNSLRSVGGIHDANRGVNRPSQALARCSGNDRTSNPAQYERRWA